LLDIVDDVSGGVRWQLWVDLAPTQAISCQIRNVQIERVDGQAIEAPSEFVDETVDHGAGVLGVKYFTTKNGNTVDVNGVVTEAAGAAIGASDYWADADGPFGYLAEGGNDNIALDSENIGGASWFKQNSTPQLDVAVAPDGTMTMDKLIDDASTGDKNVYVQQSTTVLSGQEYCFSQYAKKDQLNFLLLKTLNFDASGNRDTWFDLDQGIVGNTTHDDAGIEELANGIYRCWVTFTSTTIVTGNCRSAVTTTNGGAATVPCDGTSSIFLWGRQIEPGGFPTSYMKTEGTLVSRSADALTYPSASNIDIQLGRVALEGTVLWGASPGETTAFALSATHRPIMTAGNNTPDRFVGHWSSDQSASRVGTTMRGVVADMYGKWNETSTEFVVAYKGLDDLSPAVVTPSTSTQPIGIGCRGQTLGFQWYGTVRKVEIYDVENPA
jgi:hypothetical protein